MNLGSAGVDLPSDDDSVSVPISPDGGIRVFGQLYTDLYVCTHIL